MRKYSKHLQRTKGRIGTRAFKDFEQLIALTFGGNLRKQRRGLFHCFARLSFDLEIEGRGLTHRA